jgi:malonate-semialdehyde dehydrogenase (acetylating)/methylmalonate-semialdehyde dehydrogenase
MPDANFDRSIGIITESFYGCAGERCLAGSMLVPVGDAHVESRDRLVASARALKVGDGTEPGVTMGPVISAGHKERVLGFIDKGVAEGAKLLVDGRGTRVADRPWGYFVGPTIFDDVSPKMSIGHDEIFGPVASICPVKTLDEAIAMMKAHLTPTRRRSSRRAVRRPVICEARHGVDGRCRIGVAAPMAYFPFGGAKDSFFGDLKAHGRDGIEFYTDKKVTISRWF